MIQVRNAKGGNVLIYKLVVWEREQNILSIPRRMNGLRNPTGHSKRVRCACALVFNVHRSNSENIQRYRN
jgi:hypothetical protein